MNLTPKVKRRAKIAAVYVGLIAFLFVSVPGAPAELIPTSPQSYLLAMSWDLAALFLFCLKIGVVIGLVLDSVQRLHHAVDLWRARSSSLAAASSGRSRR